MREDLQIIQKSSCLIGILSNLFAVWSCMVSVMGGVAVL